MTAKKRAPANGYDHGFVIEQNNATGGISFWERNDNHSLADRYGISTADYIHAMYGFIRQAESRHILMVGCGGGTLATMLRRVGVKVTIVDIDARNYEIARSYFHMPEDVECYVADGAAFLRRDKRKYDAIVLDAYCDNEIPKHMRTTRFLDLVKSRLKARSAFVLVNLIAGDAQDCGPDRFAKLMQKTWRNVRLLDDEGRKSRNLIAVAGSVRKLAKPRLLMRPKSGLKTLKRELGGLDFRALRT
jgi:spermidine synthase